MNVHLFVVHFPVSFVLLAAVLEALGVALGDAELRYWGWRFLLVGAIAIFIAFVTGEGAKLDALGPGGVDIQRIATHEQWGSVGIWAIVGAALMRTLWRHHVHGARAWANLLIVVAAAGLVIMITISGTLVRHG